MSKTFQPDSLHPYIMDARLKKATGSGGISNIPIASAETLGGIKVPADSGITITGSGNAYAYKPANYSITEHKTGRKWTDGNDIYEKSIELSNQTITADTAFDVVASTGIARLLHGWLYTTGENGGGYLDVWIASDTVKAKSQSTFSSGTATVTLEYTKS